MELISIPLAIRNLLDWQSMNSLAHQLNCFSLERQSMLQSVDLRRATTTITNCQALDSQLATTCLPPDLLVLLTKLLCLQVDSLQEAIKTSPDYLDKVKTYEQQIENFTDQIDDRLWMKRILHFAGGTSDQEQELFASYLRNHRLIAEDTLYGGQITTFVKNLFSCCSNSNQRLPLKFSSMVERTSFSSLVMALGVNRALALETLGFTTTTANTPSL